MANTNQIFKNPLGVLTKGIFCFKATLFLSLFFLCTIGVAQTLSQPKLEILEAKKNFGSVKRGALVKNEYEITNTGNQPLIISNAEVPCSCTTVDFPKEPILPGQKSKVVVNFNTASVYGRQDRVVYLISNDPSGPHKLRYKGSVSNK